MDVFVDWCAVENFATVFHEETAEFFGEVICFAFFGGTVVDVVLHEFKESW